MKGLLLGHSFIRRIKSHLAPTRTSQDILFEYDGSQLAQNLQVNNYYNQIYTICQNLNLVSQLQSKIRVIRQLQPDIIIIDIGSNDLSSLTEFNPTVCLKLANEVVQFAEVVLSSVSAIKKVILNSVIPTFWRIACDKNTCMQNAQCYNQIIKNLTEDSNNIHYCKLRGFYNSFPVNDTLPFWIISALPL